MGKRNTSFMASTTPYIINFNKKTGVFTLISTKDEVKVDAKHKKYEWLKSQAAGRIVKISDKGRWNSSKDYIGLYDEINSSTSKKKSTVKSSVKATKRKAKPVKDNSTELKELKTQLKELKTSNNKLKTENAELKNETNDDISLPENQDAESQTLAQDNIDDMDIPLELSEDPLSINEEPETGTKHNS